MKRVIFFLFLMSLTSNYAMQTQTPKQIRDSFEGQLKSHFVPWPDAHTVLQLLRHHNGDQTLKKIAMQNCLWENERSGLIDLLYNLINLNNLENEAARAMDLLIEVAQEKKLGKIVNNRKYKRSPGDEGITLLRSATAQGNLPCAQVLLKHNADVNQYDIIHSPSDVIIYPLKEAYLQRNTDQKYEKLFALLKSRGAVFYPCDHHLVKEVEQ